VRDRRGLDELRPVPDDRDYSHNCGYNRDMEVLRGIISISRHMLWYVDYQCGGEARPRH
jgi:hypothetical protein